MLYWEQHSTAKLFIKRGMLCGVEILGTPRMIIGMTREVRAGQPPPNGKTKGAGGLNDIRVILALTGKMQRNMLLFAVQGKILGGNA